MTVLRCDYDGRVPAAFVSRVAFVAKVHALCVDHMEIHKTRRGYHAVIYVRQRMAFARVVLIQALLGSDWKRELYNSRRALAWRHVPAFWRSRANVLYHRHYRSVKP